MAEQLLTTKQAAAKLAVNVRTFYRYRARLIAKGLQQVNFGQYPKYREFSLDKLIKQAAETGEQL